MTPTQRHTQQVPKYRALLRITTEVLTASRQVVTAALAAPGPDLLTAAQIAALAQAITAYAARTDRVVAQARRRVLQGETVANEDKILSIFEPHTDLITRGKAQRPVEFGHKVLLNESGRGLMTPVRGAHGQPHR